MRVLFSRYIMIVKRWVWLIVAGIVICGGVTYIVSKLMPPVYQASVTIVVNADPTSYDSTTASIAALPTYAQLISNPLILQPVLANHPGMSLQQLDTMIYVKPVAGTQLIELDVTNGSPQLAKQLSDEISQSFAQYANSQLPGAVVVLPSRIPDTPIRPKPALDAGIGALVGLGLAIAMMVIFEGLADRLRSSGEAQELLAAEILMDIPRLSESQLNKKPDEIPVLTGEGHIVCHSLNSAQATTHFKSIMVTSALEHEGKSTIARTIAAFLAAEGKHVLLVDAHMQHPVLHQQFHLDNQAGFANVLEELLDASEIEHYIQESTTTNLFVLPAGTPTLDYVRLLRSQSIKRVFTYFKHAPFDYILFDSPPLQAEAGARLLACNMQAAILVIDPSQASRGAVQRAGGVLNRTNTPLLGLVINKSNWSDSEDMYADNVKQKSTFSSSNIIIDEHGQAVSGSAPVTVDDPITLKLSRVDIHQKVRAYNSHAPQTDQ